MKQRLVYIGAILGLLLISSRFFEITDNSNVLPQPKTVITNFDKSIDHELREQREKDSWLAEIHQTAPGVDWQKMDEDYRMSRLRNQQSGLRSNIGFINAELQGTWTEKGSNNQSGRVVYALFNRERNEIISASAGGIIWKTDLDSIHWIPLNDHFRIEGINFIGEITGRSQNRYVACSNNGNVYYSDDTCKSWNPSSGLDDIQNWGSIVKMVQCNDSSFFLLCNELNSQQNKETYSVYFSKNGAQSFSRIASYLPSNYWSVKNLDIHSISPTDSVAFLFYRDSISAWYGHNGSYALKEAVYPNNWGEAMLTGGRTNNGYCLYAFVEEEIYQSNLSASVWTKKGDLKQRPFTSNSMTYSQKDTSALFFGAVEFFKSYDHGANWKKMNNWWSYYDNVEDSLHADIPFIGRFDKTDGSEFFLIGTDGGLYVSYDTLNSVKNLSLSGHNISQYYSTYTEEGAYEYTFAGSQDQGLQRTSDSSSNKSYSFAQTISGDYGHLGSTDSGKTLWAVYPGFIGYYQNAKTDSAFSHSWDFNDSLVAALWMPPLIVNPGNPEQAHLIGVYRKNDANKASQIFDLEISGNKINWTSRSFNFNISPAKDEYLSGLSISPLDDQTWYAVTNKGNFYYSFDGGVQWNRSSFFTGPGPHYFYGTDIYASTSNPNHVYVSGSGYSNPAIYFSWNKGRDWRELVDSLPNTLVHAITGNANDSLLFAATELGPFVYSKENGHWYDLTNSAAPDQNYWSVEFLEGLNTARFGTYGRGIWDFKIKETEKDTNVSMLEIIESKNPYLYPNPAVELVYIGGIETPFTFVVYDQQGREVIREKNYDSGITTSGLSSGIYFIGVRKSGSTELLRLVKQ